LGLGFTTKLWFVVVVPHSFVTLNAMVCVPDVLKATEPGFEALEVAGLPAPNVHA
jgi:hypothetical protein